PKDLPLAMRTAGQWMGKLRGMTKHFRSGIDAMIREAEIEEQEKHWSERNAKIMREHPPENGLQEAKGGVEGDPADPPRPDSPPSDSTGDDTTAAGNADPIATEAPAPPGDEAPPSPPDRRE
ncbi:MAG: hypothetical protein LC634_08135, partial [Sphingomonadales bacterium]|nr:hypothetical protein [Sphingomonadales bacterium]